MNDHMTGAVASALEPRFLWRRPSVMNLRLPAFAAVGVAVIALGSSTLNPPPAEAAGGSLALAMGTGGSYNGLALAVYPSTRSRKLIQITNNAVLLGNESWVVSRGGRVVLRRSGGQPLKARLPVGTYTVKHVAQRTNPDTGWGAPSSPREISEESSSPILSQPTTKEVWDPEAFNGYATRYDPDGYREGRRLAQRHYSQDGYWYAYTRDDEGNYDVRVRVDPSDFVEYWDDDEGDYIQYAYVNDGDYVEVDAERGDWVTAPVPAREIARQVTARVTVPESLNYPTYSGFLSWRVPSGTPRSEWADHISRGSLSRVGSRTHTLSQTSRFRVRNCNTVVLQRLTGPIVKRS